MTNQEDLMVRKAFVIVLLLGLYIVVGDNAQATHVSLSSSTGHAGPVTTTSAAMLQQRQVAFDLQTEFTHFNIFSDAELIRFAEQEREIHNVESVLRYIASISYGITNDVMIHARVPYVHRNNIEESEPPDEVHGHGDAKGFGDLSLYLHHRFYKSSGNDLEATILAGLKVPTGRTTDKDDHGEKFEAEFQPGSGSWDPSLGIAVTRRLGNFALDANLLYTLVTEGTQDTDLGDTFAYNLALSYRALKAPVILDLIAEANGIWLAKEKIDGHKDENSGGNVILISPGARLVFLRHLSTYFSFGIPVLQDLNGEQNKLDYRVLFGISWML
jgi:hypothetical protein